MSKLPFGRLWKGAQSSNLICCSWPSMTPPGCTISLAIHQAVLGCTCVLYSIDTSTSFKQWLDRFFCNIARHTTGVCRCRCTMPGGKLAVIKHANMKVCEPTCAHLKASVSVCGACRYLT